MTPRLYLLAAGTFTIGTTAYLITSLLPAISAELGVSQAVAGQLSTTFALAYAISAPIVATVTGRWNRRTLLVVALLTTVAGNLISAAAPSFAILATGRVVAAIGAAAFTPTATLVAAGLLPERRGRAVAIVFGGLTLAMAAGVPAGGLLAPLLGFRGVHVAVAALGLVIALAVARVVPSVPAPAAAGVGMRERLRVAADPRALAVLAMSVIGVVAAMTTYTYLVPFLGAVTQVHGLTVIILLVTYGVGAMIGNTLGGRATDRFGTRTVLLAVLIGFTVLVVFLPLAARSVIGAGILLLLWGLFGWAFNPPVQTLLVEISGPRAGLLISLNASAIYLGSGIAGGLGGLVIGVAGAGVLPYVSAGLGVLGLVIGIVTVLRRERVPARQRAGVGSG
ncbi:MFS transporter [Microlunatus speluncae]|uniref:MFS transporter n=1 Tax=Microlunatus speluncae TaxID=2594267 RepID=UPI00126622C5|nr:MFS transporter [Microlunatus speluncae]